MVLSRYTTCATFTVGSLEIAQKNFIASLKHILSFVSSVIRFALLLLGFFNVVFHITRNFSMNVA